MTTSIPVSNGFFETNEPAAVTAGPASSARWSGLAISRSASSAHARPSAAGGAGTGVALAVFAALWSVVILDVGAIQMSIMPGDLQALHLIIGLSGGLIAETLEKRTRLTVARAVA